VRLRGGSPPRRAGAREAVRQLSDQCTGGSPVIERGRSQPRAASKLLKLCALRAGFALGGRFAPRQTVERAARLFATPHGSSRSRARAVRADEEMRRCEIATGERTIAAYVWGEPTREPYVLLAHGWSSFGLRFLPWVARLRQ